MNNIEIARNFSPEVVAALIREEGARPDQVPFLAAQYIRDSQIIPGAPQIEALTPDLTRAIRGTPSFVTSADIDWNGYIARVADNDQFEKDGNNPFLPNWDGKTEDKPSIWRSDTGVEIDDLGRKRITELFYLIQRPLGKQASDSLRRPPCPNPAVMYQVTEALKQFPKILVRPMGVELGDNSDFMWSSTLPMLCSLGFDNFRQFARHVAAYSDYADFQAYARANDTDLGAALVEAIGISGYPVNLAHVNCSDMIDVLEGLPLTKAPRWLPSLVLIHSMKHVRYYQNIGGDSYLHVAYRGRHAFIPIHEDGGSQPLCAMPNQSLRSTLQSVLHISGGSGKKKTVCEIAVAGVLNQIHPCNFTRPIPAFYRPDIIIAPGVTVMQSITNQHEKKTLWIDPGIGVHNLGKFDPSTGEITAMATVDDEMSLSMEWPLKSKATEDDLKQWLSELPTKVNPCLPSNLVFPLLRNINDLGFPLGLKHLYDGVMLANYARAFLVGTTGGSMLRKEYPAVWALPMGSTREETTNQGKTNFCRISAQVFVPGIRETHCSTSTSPPMQRSAASQIDQYGMALYDEYTPPKSPDHFLHTFGLAILCTGGSVNPGRAMENSTGIRLKFPIFFAAKTGPDVEDVMNRSFMIFMDTLNDSNRSTPEEVKTIMSGSYAAYMRLSLMLWVNKNDIIDKIKNLEPVTGVWRYDATMAIVKFLAGDDFPEVEKYLKASIDQCKAQRREASASNLMGDLGVRDTFYPEYYFQNCDEETLNDLCYQCKAKGPIRMLNAARALVEDKGKRHFGIECGKYQTEERGATQQFTKALKSGPWKRGEYTMSLGSTEVKLANSTWTKAAMIVREGFLPGGQA